MNAAFATGTKTYFVLSLFGLVTSAQPRPRGRLRGRLPRRRGEVFRAQQRRVLVVWVLNTKSINKSVVANFGSGFETLLRYESISCD